jgi:hypothetical protein
MKDIQPLACSLGAADLEQRLAGMAEIGARRLTGRSVEDGRQVLRFRADAPTRTRLEEIVAAEAECCSFLDLSLTDDGAEVVLSIAAPRDAEPIAEEIAAAFGVRA